VTNSHRSAAANSSRARARLAATTESMSGASSRATPGVSRGALTTCITWSPARVDRTSPDSSDRSLNQAPSRGWQTSTGPRVVGRSTPAALTGARTRLLTRVDLPAPVDPPTTASRGASIRRRRGTR
jgi:hypothetical protein